MLTVLFAVQQPLHTPWESTYAQWFDNPMAKAVDRYFNNLSDLKEIGSA
ncbi:hypothetical protein SAMN05216316_2759 [Nitrosovibrio sp. Nv6]|nr:hypothetical protein SAMN05216316_2759 [Nitrosovibrio sp. Nv6]